MKKMIQLVIVFLSMFFLGGTVQQASAHGWTSRSHYHYSGCARYYPQSYYSNYNYGGRTPFYAPSASMGYCQSSSYSLGNTYSYSYGAYPTVSYPSAAYSSAVPLGTGFANPTIMSLLGNSNPGNYSSGQSAYLNLPLSLGYGQTGSLQMPMGNASGKPSYLQIPLSNGFGPSVNIQIELGRPGDVSPSSVPPNATSNPATPTQFGANNQPIDRFTSIIPKSSKDEYPTSVASPPLVNEHIQFASQPKLAAKGFSHFVSIPSQTDLSIELPKDTGFSITSPDELDPIHQPDYPSTAKQDLVPWVVQ